MTILIETPSISHRTPRNTDFNETTKVESVYVNNKLKAYFFPSMPGVNLNAIRMTNISLYSTTPWQEADFMSSIIIKFFKSRGHNKSLVITDATANVGGNTISFYLNGFNKVNAVEIESFTCSLLKNNLKVYGKSIDNVHCTNYLSIADKLEQDVIFIDPPWGGPNYKSVNLLDIYLDNTNIVDLCNRLMLNKRASLIVLKLPTNYNLNALINGCPNNDFLVHKVSRLNKGHLYNLIFCF